MSETPPETPAETLAETPAEDTAELDEHTRLLQEVREKYGEPPREGSLRKLAPGQGLALIGLVCCAWTPFILWYVFGPAAVVLGILAYRQGEKRAKWLVLAAVLCMVAGIVMNNLPDEFVSN